MNTPLSIRRSCLGRPRNKVIGSAWPFSLDVRTVSAVRETVCCPSLPRLAAVRRFRQSLAGALLHPLGVLVPVAIQWYALVRNRPGRPANWKGRAYPARPVPEAAQAERGIS
jgi:hypothetical protein